MLPMDLRIRIFDRWIVACEAGVWKAIEGPEDLAVALNALREDPPVGVTVEAQRLREARRLYPDSVELRSRSDPGVAPH
jgi:hypothetical protein